MNRHCGSDIGCQSTTRFRRRFQQALRESTRRGYSVAESFGPSWERVLEEIPIEEDDQGRLYRELIQWARSDHALVPRDELAILEIWSETVHEY